MEYQIYTSVLRSNCKIINSDKFLLSDKNQIRQIIDNYSEKLDQIFSDDAVFHKIFSIDDCSFWLCIKTILIDTYKKRIPVTKILSALNSLSVMR